MTSRIISAVAGSIVGIGWIYVLYSISHGQGIANLDFFTGEEDWFAMGLLAFIAFAASPDLGMTFIAGLLAAQLVFLTWDGIPHGAQHLFAPTNFGESLLFALIGVVFMNWPMVIGAPLGRLLNSMIRRRSK
jgi:hypothetical protein